MRKSICSVVLCLSLRYLIDWLIEITIFNSLSFLYCIHYSYYYTTITTTTTTYWSTTHRFEWIPLDTSSRTTFKSKNHNNNINPNDTPLLLLTLSSSNSTSNNNNKNNKGNGNPKRLTFHYIYPPNNSSSISSTSSSNTAIHIPTTSPAIDQANGCFQFKELIEYVPSRPPLPNGEGSNIARYTIYSYTVDLEWMNQLINESSVVFSTSGFDPNQQQGTHYMYIYIIFHLIYIRILFIIHIIIILCYNSRIVCWYQLDSFSYLYISIYIIRWISITNPPSCIILQYL